MNKVDNRKKYNHSTDLIKYSEDGLTKRCNICIELNNKILGNGYCRDCSNQYQRLKKLGKLIELQEYVESFKYKKILLEEKYKDVKKCNTCLEIKPNNEFYPDKNAKHGLQNKCKLCVKGYNKSSDKYSKESNKIKHTIYQKKHKERWKELNRERCKYDINFKLQQTIRQRFWVALKKGTKFKSVINILGCSLEEFKKFIEDKFKSEMNWDNWGEVWELDHILPCSKYDLTILKNQEIIFHFSNHQPLFKTTDIARSFGYINEIGNRNKYNN